MDYLRSFTIGTSGLILLPHFAYFSLSKDNTKNFPFEKYIFIAPIYYGLMNMISLYISKKFKLSLFVRLLLISIISILIVFCTSFFVMSKKYPPYNTFTFRDWLYYLLRISQKHIINYNLIIYNFEKFFDLSFYVKTFVIGSSIFSYLFNFRQILISKNLELIKYNYRDVLTIKGIMHGINLLIMLSILHKYLKIELYKSIIITAFIIPILWWLLLSQYYHTTNIQKRISTIRLIIYSLIRNNILYYLFIKL